MRISDVPEPEGAHPRAGGRRVLVEVHAVGLSFIDPLQTHGSYQGGVAPPYVCGSELAGVVLEAPPETLVAPGDRVAGIVWQGAMAERALAIDDLLVRLPDGTSFVEGAGVYMNYATGWYALDTARVRPGGTVLVQGAAGGDRFLDTVRALAIGGHGIIVGFAGGAIPELRMNRLLLRNLTLTGIEMAVMEREHPGTLKRVRDGVQALLDAGRIRPAVVSTYPMEEAAAALSSLEQRTAVGKVVVEIKGG